MPPGDLGRLGGRQAHRQRGRTLAGQRRFVHLRACAVEGQAQPLQQVAAVG